MKLCLGCRSAFEGADWRCPRCGHEPRRRDGYPSFVGDDDAVPEAQPEELARFAAGQERNFWYRARARLVAWALGRYFPDARTLLEVGCGTGVMLASLRQALPRLVLAAGEPSLVALREAARRTAGVPLYHVHACRLPFVEEFDVVGAWDVLEHVEQHDRAVHEMFRALRPGGGLVVTVPQHPALWSPADEWAGHRRRYRARALVALIRDAGFEVLRVTSFVSVLLPFLVLSRLAQRTLGTKYQVDAEVVKVRPLVNRVCGSLLGLERRLIERGASFPAGGSLLVVARRR